MAAWWKFWSRAQPGEAKGVATNAMVVYGSGQAVARTVDPRSQFREGYSGNTDVFSCVQQIVGAAKGIRVVAYRISRGAQRNGTTAGMIQKQIATAKALGGTGLAGQQARSRELKHLVRKGVLVPVETHPILDLLAKPNPRQDWTELLEAWLGSYLVTGNGFLHSVAPRELAKPIELEVLRPDMTKIVKGNAEHPILRYEYGPAGREDRVETTEVLHLRTWNPTDDYWGLSPLTAAAKAIDWANAADDWNLGLVQNGGQKPGAIKVDQTLLPDQRKDIQKWVDDEWGNIKGMGRPLVLEGGMDWRDLGMTPAEAAWLEGTRHARRRICSVYKVAPELLGDSENKTYANVSEAKKGLYTEAALPLLDVVFSKLNGWLVPRFDDGIVLAYDADDIEVLHEERDKLWARVEAASDLTVDEKREAKGYPPLPNGIGNVVLVPFSLAPLGPFLPPDLSGGDDDGDAVQAGTRPQVSKAFGLRTYDAKTEYWKGIQQQRERILPRARDIVGRVLDAERKTIVAAMRKASSDVGASVAAERALGEQRAAWIAGMRKLYVGVAAPFAEQVIGSIAKDRGLPELRKASDWEAVVVAHLQTAAARKAKQITGTTLTQLRNELAQGIAAGEGIDVLAKRIDTLYLDKIIPHRSEVIARTETIAASNLGSRAGAVSTGLPLVKEWVATRDGRERDEHGDADGITTGMDDPYVVGGEELMFPGDDSKGASGGNLIQCRCIEVYTVDEGE